MQELLLPRPLQRARATLDSRVEMQLVPALELMLEQVQVHLPVEMLEQELPVRLREEWAVAHRLGVWGEREIGTCMIPDMHNDDRRQWWIDAYTADWQIRIAFLPHFSQRSSNGQSPAQYVSPKGSDNTKEYMSLVRCNLLGSIKEGR